MQYKITILAIDSAKQGESDSSAGESENNLVKWTSKKLSKSYQNFMIFVLIPFQLIALWYV